MVGRVGGYGKENEIIKFIPFTNKIKIYITANNVSWPLLPVFLTHFK